MIATDEGAAMKTLPDEAETLRLVAAFIAIADAEARRILLAIVEAKATGRTISAEQLQLLAGKAKQR